MVITQKIYYSKVWNYNYTCINILNAHDTCSNMNYENSRFSIGVENDNVLCTLSFPWHCSMVSKQGILCLY